MELSSFACVCKIYLANLTRAHCVVCESFKGIKDVDIPSIPYHLPAS